MALMPFASPDLYVGAVQAPDALPQSAVWFVFHETRLLVGETDHALPAAVEPLGLSPLRTQYLGELASRPVFVCEVDAEGAAPQGFRWSDLRSLFSRLPHDLHALAGRALQLLDWDRTHQFCGRCGTPTALRANERARECPACGLVVYPRLAPAVMALVRRLPDEILLARSARFAPGIYSVLAGFVEPGETLEQCLAREVHEEVGLRVRNVTYFGSQPWPFPHSLMIAFVCDWASGEIELDAVEIEHADWFRITALPALPQPISIARRLIDAVLAEMRQAAR
jgi:NAD+ diphosphatase